MRDNSPESRHPGESRDPGQPARSERLWIPAFAGMTDLTGYPLRSCEGGGHPKGALFPEDWRRED